MELNISEIDIPNGKNITQYFGEDNDLKITDIYEELLGNAVEEMPKLEAGLKDTYLVAQQTFPDVPDEDGEYLRLFSYICFLSYDVFVKKMLIERLLDEVSEKRQNQEEVLKKEREEQQKREKEEQKREKEVAKREKKNKSVDKQ